MSEQMKYLKQPPQKYLLDGCKLLWYADKLEEFVSGKRIMPITIDMGIHKGCNIRCTFCYGIYQKPSRDFIPTYRLLNLARAAGRVGIKGVAIIGDGEPTLNLGLYPFVQTLKDNGVASAVATNGLLLDGRKADILVKNCSWIRFNLSAIGNRYKDIHRGAGIGAYDRLEKLIRYAVERKKSCTIGIQMVLIPDCFDQILPFARKAVELGVDYAQIKQFSDAGEGMPMHFDMGKYDQVRQLLEEAEALSNDTTEIKIKWAAMKDSKNITMDNQWSFDRCIDLPFIFQISGNGKCYPCGYLFNKEKYCYGDVTIENLADILQSKRYWDIVRDVRQTPMNKLCKGQCRHTCSNQFIDRFIKEYKSNKTIQKSLIKLCGGKRQYDLLMARPPQHLEFL